MTEPCILCLQDGATQIPNPIGCGCRFPIHSCCLVEYETRRTNCMICRKTRAQVINEAREQLRQSRIRIRDIVQTFFSNTASDEYEVFQDITIRFETLFDNINNYNIQRYQINNILINDDTMAQGA